MEVQVKPWIAGGVTTAPSLDYIFVRDSHRERLLITNSAATRYMLLAALSSDPRTFEELSLAWVRYQPQIPLAALPWQEPLDETPHDANWLWLDLNQQAFAWHDHVPDEDDISALELPYCGLCYFEPDGNASDQAVDVWMNVPPWWHYSTATSWFDLMPMAWPVQPPLDYRDILYGNAFRAHLAAQVLSFPPQRLRKIAEDSEQWRSEARQLHVQWLMTPRDDLLSECPRAFLHAQRDWKENELAYRRAQWSHERRPPPAIPQESALYRFGPMAIDEIICYFEYCRHSIHMAMRRALEHPELSQTKLIDFLQDTQAEWLQMPHEDFAGECPWDLIHAERSLMPRIATDEPLAEHSLPLNLRLLDAEIFGPTFYLNDGHVLELEDEFAFSLYRERAEWEASRDHWLVADSIASQRTSEASAQPLADTNCEYVELAVCQPRDAREEQSFTYPTVDSPVTPGMDDRSPAWPRIWQGSLINQSQAETSLSLLLIGVRLSEFINQLRELGDAVLEVDRLTAAFDKLGAAVRAWLVAEATGLEQATQRRTALAVDNLIDLLEHLADNYPQLTSQSADLQSLIHQWQRSLMAGEPIG